uniref:ribosomal protein S4 n=1 Tax=Thalassionema nitzschioides TaxID=33649 RepID=UPI001EDFAC56|nr:ribosomal protein S4 [Thalassionema nitzschioides]UHY40708.1 ribosomal protein S4 [Thalassionema nitzschioides]
MSRYRGPKLRITRRLGPLPALTQKRSKNNSVRPGQHGKANSDNNKKTTEYGLRLEEKQKLRFNYGLTENQLYRYIKEARRRKGVTGLILLQLLEMRLDTICYNLGFASTIGQARQIVNHGHILVNNKRVNIPSFQCRINDKIKIQQKSKSKNLVERNLNTNKSFNNLKLLAHLKLNEDTLEATVLDFCDRNDINLDINELLVIEYYSRR